MRKYLIFLITSILTLSMFTGCDIMGGATIDYIYTTKYTFKNNTSEHLHIRITNGGLDGRNIEFDILVGGKYDFSTSHEVGFGFTAAYIEIGYGDIVYWEDKDKNGVLFNLDNYNFVFSTGSHRRHYEYTFTDEFFESTPEYP